MFLNSHVLSPNLLDAQNVEAMGTIRPGMWGTSLPVPQTHGQDEAGAWEGSDFDNRVDGLECFLVGICDFSPVS